MRDFLKNPLILIFFAILAFESLTAGGSIGNWIYTRLLILPGIVIGVAFHEFAHAKVAHMLGDDTPKLQGRVSLNPLVHIDILGFFAIFFIGFGWGKAVEVNPYNFKNRRRDGFLVSIAGVVANFILALIFGAILAVVVRNGEGILETSSLSGTVIEILQYVIWMNLILMIFNLIPVPPLDGFGIATEIFNLEQYDWYYKVYNNGFIILMALLIFGVINKILTPAVTGIYSWILNLFIF